MAYDLITSGIPTIAAASATVANALDTNTGAEHVSFGNGWQPLSLAVAKASATAQTANVASLLVYTAPVTAVYNINAYLVSANAPTGATLPSVTATFTDGDTGTSTTATVQASTGSVSAANTVASGDGCVYAKGGTTITIATASYAAGSGTALSYNVKVRVSGLG